MVYISKYDIFWFNENLLNHYVNFISDCNLIPGFNVTGKVIKIYNRNNIEIMFDIITNDNHKKLTIGSNMRNLQFNIIS